MDQFFTNILNGPYIPLILGLLCLCLSFIITKKLVAILKDIIWSRTIHMEANGDSLDFDDNDLKTRSDSFKGPIVRSGLGVFLLYTMSPTFIISALFWFCMEITCVVWLLAILSHLIGFYPLDIKEFTEIVDIKNMDDFHSLEALLSTYFFQYTDPHLSPITHKLYDLLPNPNGWFILALVAFLITPLILIGPQIDLLKEKGGWDNLSYKECYRLLYWCIFGTFLFYFSFLFGLLAGVR